MHPLVERIFVPPAANDAGTSMGAAAYVAVELGERIKPIVCAYYGPEYDAVRIRSALDNSGLQYKQCNCVTEEVAGLLADGKIVGWFQGRMEFGPRALGNRSILAHPAVKGTKDQINAMVKFREWWRPFCPSVLEEYSSEIFSSHHSSPFMTLAFTVNDEWRSKIPEVVHVDGTARPQTVNRTSNPRFYDLIAAFHRKTNLPIVLNTSLNRQGEPMVCTPEDAIKMFLGCGLRYLCIGDYLVTK